VESKKDRAARIQARLLAIKAEDLAPPYVDPRMAALVALGVVDFARSKEGSERFAELASLGGFDAEIVDDLERLADALLRVFEAFEVAPRAPNAVTIPPALDQQCRAARETLVDLLQTKAPYAPGVSAALGRVQLAYGPVDLAFDLRTLSALAERNSLDAKVVGDARSLAHKLESVLTTYDTEELREARRALRRVWFVFEETYRQLCSVGREIFSDDPEAMFPTLDAIANIERNARHSSTSLAPASLIVERGIPHSRRTSVSSRRMRAIRRANLDAAPLNTEVVLSLTSESTLWLGFSQDIAEGGVFVATYQHPPLGAPMELELQFPDRELKVKGVVHWARPAQAGDDLPAGVGVRLTNLSADDAKVLHTFAARRTPIFYDD
jgi:uncharacterized protein (TIGR02266 family)